MFLQLLFSLLLLLLFLSLFSFNPCNSNTVNGTGLKLAHKSGTITGRAVACYFFDMKDCPRQYIIMGDICISYNMPKRYVAGLWTRDPRARSARGGSVHKPQHTD